MNEVEQRSKNTKDMIGFRSGLLTVVEWAGYKVLPSGLKHAQWKSLCECGGEVISLATNLKREGHTTSCGCVKKQNIAKHRERVKSGEWIPEKLVGERFGRLVVENFTKWHINNDGQRVSMWNCICDCGNSIEMRRSYLQTTEVPSCGCRKSEVLSEIQTKHGMTGTPTHQTWRKMKERCLSGGYVEKEYYQKQGIDIYQPWIESFENFYADMGERPEGMTLDRIDGTKGYYPDNCRWADLTIQAYNRKKGSNNTSGRVGVFELPNGLYKAGIGYYKEFIVLANNVSFDDACKAREEAELKYYGWTKE